MLIVIDCTNREIKLFFNRIYQGTAFDEKFNDVKYILDSFLAGGTSLVLNHGCTGSGKTLTMFGSNEPGLLQRSGEYILQQTKFFASAVEVNERGCFELYGNQSLLKENHQPTRTILESTMDLRVFIDKVNTNRTQKPTNQNATSSRSHLIITLSLENGNAMAFVDLAGFESSNNKDNAAESIFINKTLTELTSYLISLTRGTVYVPPKSNQIVKILKPFFTPKCKTVMMYHVKDDGMKKGLELIKDIVSSSRKLKRANPLSNITNKILHT